MAEDGGRWGERNEGLALSRGWPPCTWHNGHAMVGQSEEVFEFLKYIVNFYFHSRRSSAITWNPSTGHLESGGQLLRLPTEVREAELRREFNNSDVHNLFEFGLYYYIIS
jgi:hypothetical protein